MAVPTALPPAQAARRVTLESLVTSLLTLARAVAVSTSNTYRSSWIRAHASDPPTSALQQASKTAYFRRRLLGASVSVFILRFTIWT